MEANILGMERGLTVQRAKTSAERHMGCVRLAWCLPSIKRSRQTVSGDHREHVPQVMPNRVCPGQ